MAVKLNTSAERNARALINDGHVNKTEAWSITPEEENHILGDPPDWTAYGKWHLGRDDGEDRQSKAAWKYPVGKNGQVFRSALVAIRQRSAQQGATDVFEAAGKLIDLIDGNEGSDARWTGGYEIRAGGQTPEEGAEVVIYGDIGESWLGDTITARDLVAELAEIDRQAPLSVRINSYGGSVSDGIAIYNALRRHAGGVSIGIDGVAVSVASLIAMAGDTVEMAENAVMMIHAPWSMAIGNAADLREMADVLDTYAKAMSSSYVSKSGQPLDVVMGWLTDGQDHWMTAAEAKDYGLVDTITADRQQAAASLDGTRFGRRRPQSRKSPIEDPAMSKENPQAPEPKLGNTDPNKVVDIETAVQARMNGVATRNAEIRAAFKPFMSHDGVNDLLLNVLEDPELTKDQANAKLLAHIGNGVEPIAKSGSAQIIGDQRDRVDAGIRASIMDRTGIKHEEKNNDYRGYSLIELARVHCQARNIDVKGLGKMELVKAAFTHTDSDFPNLLANIAHKELLRGWQEAPETFPMWTNPGTLADFKPTKRVDLNTFSALDEIPEGSEYQYGEIGDRGETIALATYGKLFTITRQAIINDDLDAFQKIPTRMGRAAKRTVGNLVYAVLTGNPAMADGIALFHATHKNLAGTGTTISTASVQAMITGMDTQEDNGNPLNIALKYLVVPSALEGLASSVANSEYEVGTGSTKNITSNNYVRGKFEVIKDARLDKASSISWYGVADPGVFDTVEVAYLDGQQEPYLERELGFDVDGVAWKVRIDAGVKALDYRSFQKNPGA